MVITKEFKESLIQEINNDTSFAILLFRAIQNSTGETFVTTNYLDQALAKQSREFDKKLAEQSKEFDKKLARIVEEFKQMLAEQSDRFDKKLAEQSDRFDKKLDTRLTEQEVKFDKKLETRLAEQSAELKTYINNQFSRIGSRWGMNVEENYRNFAQAIVSQWGGTVTKWRRKIKATDDEGRRYILRYEVDLVVANGTVMLVEMKASCDDEALERYIENVTQYMNLESPTRPVEKVILTFDMDEHLVEKAQAAGITVIMPEY